MISFRTKAAMVILSLFSSLSCQKELVNLNPDTQKVRVYFVSTYAGSFLQEYLDGPALQSTLKSPFGITAATDGTLFITDNANNNIRKISPEGMVGTVMPVNSLQGPSGITTGPDGSLYVCESLTNRIIKISPDGSLITLNITELCDDGTFMETTLNSPNGIAIADDGSIYVADTFNNKIRKINPDGKSVVVAGSTAGFQDGKGAEAKFYFPFGIALDKEGSIYVSDYGNNSIRKISKDGSVSTLAGSKTAGKEDNQSGTLASFNSPTDLAIADDGTIYISDYANSRIRAILTTGEVTTIAGTDNGWLDGVGITAKFHNPVSLAIHKNTLFITDSNNSRIRRISLD